LKGFKDPETGRSVIEMDQVRELQVSGDRLAVTLALTTHSAPLWDETYAQLEQHLRSSFPEAKQVEVRRAVHARPPLKLGQIGLTAKSVIAVGSGKGGVGKSTIAACLAYGLKRAGCTVGLLDADVYGPSIPHLVGCTAGQVMPADNKLLPVEKDGLKVMSIGFVVPKDKAVIWRGPMLHHYLTSFLRDTAWGELDYLIIDLPPGTGDVSLSLSQLLPLTGAVVVCTPQDVALLDAEKAIAMFRTLNVPVLGMVENMSSFICTACGTRHDIFGTGGARAAAERLQVPFLGEVPINVQIRIRGDAGQTGANFDDAASSPYLTAICQRLVRGRTQQPAALPKLSVL
jgi:ATP-binding protein involved in chromosome partitioning